MTSGIENKANQKKYPLMPYIIAMIVVVVVIVLISYFAQTRNNNEQISEYNQQHRTRYADYECRLNELEVRIEALEKKTK